MKTMMKKIAFLKIILGFFILLISLQIGFSQNKSGVLWRDVRILVYTKNGKGYVHDNIPFAVNSIKKLGQSYGFKVDVADTALVFTRENLQKYHLLIFTSTNNDVFDTDEQRLNFRHFIEAGGGFVGIHSVVGTERNWTWFKQLIGGTFAWHAKFQRYRVNVLDNQHPSMQGLPAVWEKEDECYFEKEMYPGIHTLLVQDVKSLSTQDDKENALIKQHSGSFGNYYPAAWYQFFDGGLAWITTLGHDKKDYEDPIFIKHIFQGIRFVANNVRPVDFSKAYATHRDSEVR
jgi:type 1 glutamine amidotransferase